MSKTFNRILPDKFKRWFRDRLNHLSLLLSHFGLSPNTITLISLLFGLIAGVLIAIDHMLLAVLFGIVMGFCDIIDGQLAIITNQNNPFGAVLDSSIDRYNESFIFIGFAVHYYLHGEPIWIFIVALTLTGSFIVSYVKARAEGKNLQCPVGLMQRAERLVLLGIGVIFQGWILKVILLTLALFTHFTVFQRLIFVKKVITNEKSKFTRN